MKRSLNDVIFAVLVVSIFAVSIVQLVSMPTVAFNQEGKCIYVESDLGREKCSPEVMPDRYNTVIVSNSYK